MSARETLSDRTLHKMGAVLAGFVRCGKPNCRCARGQLHGPYWSRYWRDAAGRLHRSYIRKAEAAAAVKDQQRFREADQVFRAFKRDNWREFRRMREEIRKMVAPYQLPKQRGNR